MVINLYSQTYVQNVVIRCVLVRLSVQIVIQNSTGEIQSKINKR